MVYGHCPEGSFKAVYENKEGRSILQETVVRNMPFCEEFIIVTNEEL